MTAARFALGTDRAGNPRGELVYGRNYLARADAVPIDPIELKLAPVTYQTLNLRGVFGALRDASPDYWGRRVIERLSGGGGLTEVDYLLYSSDDRAGALAFGLNPEPPAPRRDFNRTIELPHLQQLADRLIAEEEAATPPEGAEAEQVEELLLLGTSMGGARPKVIVEDSSPEGGGPALWLAKFNRVDDRFNHARVEHAMLRLASECGLHAAESRVVQVGDQDALLVRRFDRARIEAGYRRARMLSALTLLRAGDTYQDRERWSYVILAEELRRLSSDARADARELFRRMLFNALISNTDDHPRNHAVIAMDTDFRLAPAYDLTPFAPVSVERRDLAMSIGDAGRYAQADNLLSQCARFLLTREEAGAVTDSMEAQVKARWYAVARAAAHSIQRLWSIARPAILDVSPSRLLAKMSPLEIRSNFGSHFKCRGVTGAGNAVHWYGVGYAIVGARQREFCSETVAVFSFEFECLKTAAVSRADQTTCSQEDV